MSSTTSLISTQPFRLHRAVGTLTGVSTPVPDLAVTQASPALAVQATVSTARIFIVDDDRAVLESLRIHLEDAGYGDVVLSEDSSCAMELLRSAQPDLLLTDLRMPQVTGFDLLEQVRADRELAHLPVVMLTADSDAATRMRALELGVTDFLAKPVDPSELMLRVRNHLVVKSYQDELAASRSESDRLLLNILPESVADRLKRGEVVADHFDEATVLFADLVNFTDFSSRTDAASVVRHLNEVFRLFDQLVAASGVEKIKTIGDAYMLAGGVPTPRPDHARAVLDVGLAMLSACEGLQAWAQSDFQLRIGVHTGPVLAGVIGSSKFSYDLWGDTVNVASRMESQGVPGRIQISDATRCAVGDRFDLEHRGEVHVKGKGAMRTWFVRGARHRDEPADPSRGRGVGAATEIAKC